MSCLPADGLAEEVDDSLSPVWFPWQQGGWAREPQGAGAWPGADPAHGVFHRSRLVGAVWRVAGWAGSASWTKNHWAPRPEVVGRSSLCCWPELPGLLSPSAVPLAFWVMRSGWMTRSPPSPA